MLGWWQIQNKAVKASWKQGLFLAAPMIAYSAGHAERGEKLPDAVAKSVSFLGVPALATTIGAMTGNPLLGLALSFLPADGLERRIHRAVRTFSDFDRQVRRIQCGGNYRDTETAAALRDRSIRDMSGAFGTARRWLGNESLLMHR